MQLWNTPARFTACACLLALSLLLPVPGAQAKPRHRHSLRSHYAMRAHAVGRGWHGLRWLQAHKSSRTTSSPPPLRIGMNANTVALGDDQQQWQAQIGSVGVRYLREEFDWSSIEASPGVWDWSRYDRMMLNAAAAHMTVLPLLSDAPAWAGNGVKNELPADPTQFASFVAQAAARYGPGGTLWSGKPALAAYAPQWFEIWNEPWALNFTANHPDPVRYARLVKASVAAGRKANKQARFLLEADLSATQPDGTDVEWIDSMYRAVPDLSRWFDAIAIHPYTQDPPSYFTPQADTRWEFPRIDLIHDKFAAHGDGAKHMWITEVGWSTCATGPGCVSEATQASYVTQVMSMLRSQYSTLVDAVFWYGWRDWDYSNPNDLESAFGFVRPDGSYKPAVAALSAAAGLR